MAKRNADEPELEPLDALAARVAQLEDAQRTATAEIAELTHDVAALVEELGAIFGNPFRQRADAIVKQRQVGSPPPA